MALLRPPNYTAINCLCHLSPAICDHKIVFCDCSSFSLSSFILRLIIAIELVDLLFTEALLKESAKFVRWLLFQVCSSVVPLTWFPAALTLGCLFQLTDHPKNCYNSDHIVKFLHFCIFIFDFLYCTFRCL